jgi:hypothetical protein
MNFAKPIGGVEAAVSAAVPRFWLVVRRAQRDRHCPFQTIYSCAEVKTRIASNKQVHVIRHDHITTNSDIEFRRTPERIFSKCLMNDFQTLNFTPM